MSLGRVQSSLEEGIREIVATIPAPLPTASGSDRKNYTKKLSHEAPELYERMGIVLLEPGDPDSVDLAPAGVPEHLHLANYCQEMVRSFNGRNPFY